MSSKPTQAVLVPLILSGPDRNVFRLRLVCEDGPVDFEISRPLAEDLRKKLDTEIQRADTLPVLPR